MAADIRSDVGRRGKAIPFPLYARASVVLTKFRKFGFEHPKQSDKVESKYMFEMWMEYFEIVGRFLVDDPEFAKSVAETTTKTITDKIKKTSRP